MSDDKFFDNPDIIGVEVIWWYDGTAYWLDTKTNQKYSRISYIPISEDELCRYGNIYKVKQTGDCDYKTLSGREDKASLS